MRELAARGKLRKVLWNRQFFSQIWMYIRVDRGEVGRRNPRSNCRPKCRRHKYPMVGSGSKWSMPKVQVQRAMGKKPGKVIMKAPSKMATSESVSGQLCSVSFHLNMSWIFNLTPNHQNSNKIMGYQTVQHREYIQYFIVTANGV